MRKLPTNFAIDDQSSSHIMNRILSFRPQLRGVRSARMPCRLLLKFCLGLLLWTQAALLPHDALAATGQEAAAAEALFREAQSLLEAKKFDQACPKFLASQALDPQLGTLLNLARCHEIAGQTASAWAEFLQAASIARRSGEERREEVAREHAEKLEARLVRIKIVVPEASLLPELVVTVNGAVQSSATYGTPTPIDPGDFVIEAKAPGYEPWSAERRFDVEGKTSEVMIPLLIKVIEEPEPVSAPIEEVVEPAAIQPAPVATEMRRGPTWTPGLVTAGVGVAGLAVGTVFGVLAINRWNKADCNAGVCPTQKAQDDAEKAKSFATVSTVGFIAGGILTVAGVTLTILPSSKYQERPLLAERESSPQAVSSVRNARLRVVPSAPSTDLGLSLGGVF